MVTPADAVIASQSNAQFVARVTGTSNVAVKWSASVGVVSDSGFYTAPAVSSPTPARIIAASLEDSHRTAEANITIVPGGSGSALTIVSDELPLAVEGSSYSEALQASGGKSPYQWSGIGTLPPGLSLSADGMITGTPIQAGTFLFPVQASDGLSQSVSKSLSLVVSPASNSGTGEFDGPAELPRVYLKTSMADTPTPGSVIPVAAGGDLQAALDQANCGDIVALQAGATFTGLFKLANKSCDDQHWILVRSDAPDSSLPAEGQRMTPCYAGLASLPGRPDYSCTAPTKALAKIQFDGNSGSGPILFLAGATHYRFLGLEITRTSPDVHLTDLISIRDLDTAADHLVFDRLWVHGTNHDETKGGVHLSGMTYAAVVDSYFNDFHCISRSGSCVDSQAINGGGGDLPGGPYKITNNFLEASGQSIMLGGAPGSTTPADIEVRGNYLFKRPQWQPGQPGFVGSKSGDPFIVKNHLELKNAERLLFTGNVLENNWGGFTQHGFSVVLMPSNQGGFCPKCRVTDITVRYSTINHVGGGVVIAAPDPGQTGPAADGKRFSIHDLEIGDVDASRYSGSGTLFLVINSWHTNGLRDLSIDHVTGFPDPKAHFLSVLDLTSNPSIKNFAFTNNMVGAGAIPLASAGGGSTNCAADIMDPLTSLATCFPGYVFAHNSLINMPPKYPPSKWPPHNFFPSGSPNGLVQGSASAADAELATSLKNGATDGKDIGADIQAVQAAIAGVN